MGHHHHHGGNQFWTRLSSGRRGPPAPAWIGALVFAALLFVNGAVDGIWVYQRYVHGEHGMGVVTQLTERGTTLQINGHACFLRGHRGRIGQMFPVAYLANDQQHCVIRQPASFHWAGGSIVASLAIAIGVFLYRRSSIAAAIDPSAKL